MPYHARSAITARAAIRDIAARRRFQDYYIRLPLPPSLHDAGHAMIDVAFCASKFTGLDRPAGARSLAVFPQNNEI